MLFDSNTNSDSVNKKMSRAEVRKASVVRDALSKGGLLAPTQSWLLHIGDKKEMKSRSPSPGPKEVKRSISVPRKLIDRSPSPKRRMQFITKDADKNVKEHQPVQASPRTQRRSLSVRASPDPNLNLKRSGSIKRVQNIEKQNTISKPSSNKSTNGKTKGRRESNGERRNDAAKPKFENFLSSNFRGGGRILIFSILRDFYVVF